jgi:hypothetical protein
MDEYASVQYRRSHWHLCRVESSQQPTPHPPHCEDYIVNPTYYRLVRNLSTKDMEALLNNIEDQCVAAIFGAQIHLNEGWFILAGQGTRSLGTVKGEVEKVVYALRGGNSWDSGSRSGTGQECDTGWP